MRYLPPSSFGSSFPRNVEAHLAADLAGGRTTLRRQHVGYPLHITRGFHLDAARPELLTLYLQSASGGLYAGDRISLNLVVDEGAAIHLTTQASTVVHDGRCAGSRQHHSLTVRGGAFCAVQSDPYALFPGADLCLETLATVADDAVLFLADGFAVHDPNGAGRIFARFSGKQRIVRPNGKLLLQDLGSIKGEELRSGALGSMTAAATVLLIAPPERLPARRDLEQAAERCGCLAGASAAPNGAGQVMRLLAPDGGTLARGMEAAFHVAAAAVFGAELARRRK
jgi:urease accessory protein